MQIIKIWNYLKGYVIIKVEGLTLERFLNLAANNDIYLWDIKRVAHTVLEMKASIEGFRALKEVVKKVGCKVEILDKKGLPFAIYRLRTRKMFGLGILIFLGLLIFLSSFIWDIEIIGNEKTKTEDIIRALEKENIKLGIIKYNIDQDYAKHFLLEEFDNFSFISVEIKGTKLIIEVKEQDLPPKKLDTNVPCNIVATKKGVIVKAIARNGKTLVRKGDIVKKGQILITGVISEDNLEEYILVHAEGEVLAKTVYYSRIDEPIIKVEKEETGKTIEMRELKIGEKGIRFLKEDIPFNHYTEATREVKLFKNKIPLPFKILIHEYKEVEIKEIKQNIDFLKKATHIRAVEELNKQLPSKGQIESKDVKYYIKDGMLSTYVVIEVIEDIGEKQVINTN
jgi:similar to stage IV sporulation protein